MYVELTLKGPAPGEAIGGKRGRNGGPENITRGPQEHQERGTQVDPVGRRGVTLLMGQPKNRGMGVRALEMNLMYSGTPCKVTYQATS